jgi:hypothetical protein
VDYSYKRSSCEKDAYIKNLIFHHPFAEDYDRCRARLRDDDLSDDIISNLNILHYRSFMDDKIDNSVKIKFPGFRKTLQLQKGQKPIRALQKIALYFSGTQYEEYFKNFEDFRIKHSMINNEDVNNVKMVFSIHPLDFMTMSDNSLNWSSCMSWMDDGCYHIGTVEMMNSNNVICCYIKAPGFTFNFDEENQDEEHCWTNKKWRNLCYYTKDIIMSGKSYPYKNDDHSKFIIKTIKELAEKNLGRTFSFGPELYKDMIHITNNNRMEKNRNWIDYGNTTKHNIIWDTRGMYNDMLNDNLYHYWCYRNKVKKNKIISVSGKAPCLCCGDQVPVEDDYYDNDYNDRYLDCGNLYCEKCFNTKIPKCHDCGNIVKEKIVVNKNGEDIIYCKSCFNFSFKECPCCGEPFFVETYMSGSLPMIEDQIEDEDCSIFGIYQPEEYGHEYTGRFHGTKHNSYSKVLHMCPSCQKAGRAKSLVEDFQFIQKRAIWEPDQTPIKKILPKIKERMSVFEYGNLKDIPTNDIKIICK